MEKQNNSMGRGERTSLTRANNDSYSLRTTVPKGIVNNFDLKEGDFLYWKIEPAGKKLMIIIVTEKKVEK